MPNQGNKSKGQSGIVQKKKNPTMPSTEKQGSGTAEKNSKKADTGSSANNGNKTASNGSETE